MEQQKQLILQQIKNAQLHSTLSADSVQLIAVTKQLSLDQTKEVVAAGLLHLGENRPEGILTKQHELEEEVVWHYIGSLQTRKVKDVIEHIDYLHSLDRISLAQEIQKRASRPLKCFIQVNVSGEQSKHGLSPIDIPSFLNELKPFHMVQPIGFMTMAPLEATDEEIRTYFKTLRELRDRMLEDGSAPPECKELSMGMSGDFTLAVEEGATFVRIGTALVGSIRE